MDRTAHQSERRLAAVWNLPLSAFESVPELGRQARSFGRLRNAESDSVPEAMLLGEADVDPTAYIIPTPFLARLLDGMLAETLNCLSLTRSGCGFSIAIYCASRGALQAPQCPSIGAFEKMSYFDSIETQMPGRQSSRRR